MLRGDPRFPGFASAAWCLLPRKESRDGEPVGVWFGANTLSRRYPSCRPW